MIERDFAEKIGFTYIKNALDIITPMGRKHLESLEYLTDPEKIEAELRIFDEIARYIACNLSFKDNLKHRLCQLRDISGVVKRLGTGETFDDIALFEIKAFCIEAEELRRLLVTPPKSIEIPELSEVIRLLDPEGFGMKSFYIYDAYSVELAALRKRKRELEGLSDGDDVQVNEELNDLINRIGDIEDRIRTMLTERLSKYRELLEEALEKVGFLDFSLAKLEIIEKFGFIRPTVSDSVTEYVGLFEPQVSDELKKKGKEFQPVDIQLQPGVTLITGANMTGKTVLLRSLAVAQVLFQFGFYVPAKRAKIKPVDGVFFLSGDYQSFKHGLSSFAAEMIQLNTAVEFLKVGKRGLFLFDELARNTNPHEGKAIVKSVLRRFNSSKSFTVITTHYDGVSRGENVHHYMVKGLREDIDVSGEVKPETLTEYTDYSLVKVKGEYQVPREALKVATLLGVDPVIIETARELLDEETELH